MTKSVDQVSINDAGMKELLEVEILSYRNNDNMRQSPVWIWFSKLSETSAFCLICNNAIAISYQGTSNLINHMRHHHGSDRKYDAFAILQELMELRKLRRQSKKLSSVKKKCKSERMEMAQRKEKKHSADQLSNNYGSVSELLEARISSYRKDDNMNNSPVWVWFRKSCGRYASCLICNKVIATSQGSTTGLIKHVTSEHGSGSDYDAGVFLEELMELRKLRKQRRNFAEVKRIEMTQRTKSADQSSINDAAVRELVEVGISSYRRDDTMSNSPVWIWFSRLSEKFASCLICNTAVTISYGSTSSLIKHIKYYHGTGCKYDACVILQELMELRKLRKQGKKNAGVIASRKRHWESRSHETNGSKNIQNSQKSQKQKEFPIQPNWENEEGFISDDETTPSSTPPLVNDSMSGIQPPSNSDNVSSIHLSKMNDNSYQRQAYSASNLSLTHLPLPSPALSPPNSIQINVGGVLFTTSLKTFQRFPESRLAWMIEDAMNRNEQSIFIDRSGRLFEHILNFCRTSQLLLPKDFKELKALQAEAVHYNVIPMISAIKAEFGKLGTSLH